MGFFRGRRLMFGDDGDPRVLVWFLLHRRPSVHQGGPMARPTVFEERGLAMRHSPGHRAHGPSATRSGFHPVFPCGPALPRPLSGRMIAGAQLRRRAGEIPFVSDEGASAGGGTTTCVCLTARRRWLDSSECFFFADPARPSKFRTAARLLEGIGKALSPPTVVCRRYWSINLGGRRG